MFTKIIEVGSWDKMAESPVQLVKVSSRGLVGNDRADFLKTASHVFADHFDRVKLAKDDIPIHVIAIGATEGYNCNRNGDGFKESSCRKYHDTFVKHAKFYKHHQNKDPEKSYGPVKLSAYNDAMRRIELLVLGNGSKEAADRNGGLPLDAETIDKIEKRADVAVSMACRIAHDVCSNCHNKAASRAEYCTEETCYNPETGRHMQGCRDGLTKLAEDGFQQYVDNPDPLFFDISQVHRPADRTAYGWKADYMQKAASETRAMGGAELAEVYARQNGYDLLSPSASASERLIARQVKLAHQLASIEQNLLTGLTDADKALARAFAPSLRKQANFSILGKTGSAQHATGLAALAGQAIVLTLTDFVQAISGESHEKTAGIVASVSQAMPGVYGRLAADPGLESALRSNIVRPAESLAPVRQRDWAEKLASDLSLSPAAIRARVERSAIFSAPSPSLAGRIKIACAGPAEDLARQYALYTVSALSAMPSEKNSVSNELTAKAAVLQNLVS